MEYLWFALAMIATGFLFSVAYRLEQINSSLDSIRFWLEQLWKLENNREA